MGTPTAQRTILELILTNGDKNIEYCPKENSLFRDDCPRCNDEGEDVGVSLVWQIAAARMENKNSWMNGSAQLAITEDVGFSF